MLVSRGDDDGDGDMKETSERQRLGNSEPWARAYVKVRETC